MTSSVTGPGVATSAEPAGFRDTVITGSSMFIRERSESAAAAETPFLLQRTQMLS